MKKYSLWIFIILLICVGFIGRRVDFFTKKLSPIGVYPISIQLMERVNKNVKDCLSLHAEINSFDQAAMNVQKFERINEGKEIVINLRELGDGMVLIQSLLYLESVHGYSKDKSLMSLGFIERVVIGANKLLEDEQKIFTALSGMNEYDQAILPYRARVRVYMEDSHNLMLEILKELEGSK